MERETGRERSFFRMEQSAGENGKTTKGWEVMMNE